MYIRETLVRHEDSEKRKKNEKNRVRNQIVNFRTSLEEREKIENRIKLSGLSKSEFFIQSCMNQKIVCCGNVKVFDEINKQLAVIVEHICSVDFPHNLDEEVMENLRTIVELSAGLNAEKED